MTTRLGSTVKIIFFSSLLMLSACASMQTTDPITGDSINTAETIANKADATTLGAIEEGKNVADATRVPQQSVAKVADPVKSVAEAGREIDKTAGVTAAKITPKERYVNVRYSPSLKSRAVAVLKGGHSIEILDKKDNWVKIQWRKGDAVKQGWIKKSFVEAN